MKRGAFTLIELLVVIAIILMLVGLLMPAFWGARNTAKKTKAKAEVKQLDVAWRGVLTDYRSWAAAAAGATAGGQVPSANGSPQPMNIAACLYLQANNTKGVTYMEFDRGSTNASGDFIDPWYRASAPGEDRAYRVCLGIDEVTPYAGVTLNRPIAAWSRGKDILDASDDVKSWE
jgi:prepilin-type N-terminal cleavage/methylation domain-containing protein